MKLLFLTTATAVTVLIFVNIYITITNSFLTIKKKNLFILILFTITVLSFITYFKIGNFNFITLYYSDTMTEVRLKQVSIRPLIQQLNTYLLQLKYQAIRKENNPDTWYLLGKLYQLQQNYVYALNAYYNAAKQNKNDKKIQLQYVTIKFIVTKGYVNNAFYCEINKIIKNNPTNNTALAFLNIHTLLNNYFIVNFYSVWKKKHFMK